MFKDKVDKEIFRLKEKYPFPYFNGLHEAYAVLLEEIDELWDEVKKKRSKRDWKEVAHELSQIAAIATLAYEGLCACQLEESCCSSESFGSDSCCKSKQNQTASTK